MYMRPEHLDTIEVPDRKGPRFRKKSVGMLNKKFARAFFKKYPQYKTIGWQRAKAVIKLHNEKICRVAATTRDGVELQSSIGHIFVGSYKTKPSTKTSVDFGASEKAGKVVRYRNLHTDNHQAKIWYSNAGTKYVLANREIWFFTAVRSFTQVVSKIYPENWQRYVIIDHNKLIFNQRKISQDLRKKEFKRKATQFNYSFMETYNEFDV